MSNYSEAARKTGMTAAERFWYVLGCVAFGAAYLRKVPVKKALADYGLAEMTAAEQFWYVLGCVFFGAAYLAKVPVAKALSELEQYQVARAAPHVQLQPHKAYAPLTEQTSPPLPEQAHAPLPEQAHAPLPEQREQREQREQQSAASKRKADTRPRKIQGLLVMSVTPLHDSQALLQQIIDQQRESGYEFTEGAKADVIVSSFQPV